MNFLPFLMLKIAFLVSVFCIIQLVDLFSRDVKYFESHTHKLTWFLVIIVGNLIGAVWYFYWKREILKEEEKQSFDKALQRKKKLAAR